MPATQYRSPAVSVPRQRPVSRGLHALSLYDSFFSGGARILHTDVVAGLHDLHHHHEVLALRRRVFRENVTQVMEQDSCYRKLVSAGVGVTALDRGCEDSSDLARLEGCDLRRATTAIAAADVVVSLKEQPISLLTHPAIPSRPVVVCLHRSDPGHSGHDLGSLLSTIDSGLVRAVVCCAWATKAAYTAAGVPRELMTVVPNGVDLRRFRPSSYRRVVLRAELGIPPAALVVVFAARFDRMKNVPLFLETAGQLLAGREDAHVLMCGAGMDNENDELVKALPEQRDRVHLLGVRQSMEWVYAASDVVALTSAFGEAAPLCLIEGMMCGAVPVTTAVGDAARIVDGRGFVVDSDADQLAAAWEEAHARRDSLAPALVEARNAFDRESMIDSYAGVLDRVAVAALPKMIS